VEVALREGPGLHSMHSSYPADWDEGAAFVEVFVEVVEAAFVEEAFVEEACFEEAFVVEAAPCVAVVAFVVVEVDAVVVRIDVA